MVRVTGVPGAVSVATAIRCRGAYVGEKAYLPRALPRRSGFQRLFDSRVARSSKSTRPEHVRGQGAIGVTALALRCIADPLQVHAAEERWPSSYASCAGSRGIRDGSRGPFMAP